MAKKKPQPNANTANIVRVRRSRRRTWGKDQLSPLPIKHADVV